MWDKVSAAPNNLRILVWLKLRNIAFLTNVRSTDYVVRSKYERTDGSPTVADALNRHGYTVCASTYGSCPSRPSLARPSLKFSSNSPRMIGHRSADNIGPK